MQGHDALVAETALEGGAEEEAGMIFGQSIIISTYAYLLIHFVSYCIQSLIMIPDPKYPPMFMELSNAYFIEMLNIPKF
jgi:hypothetical protein